VCSDVSGKPRVASGVPIVRAPLHSWIGLELRALAWSIAVGTVAAFVTELAILRVVGLVWTDLLVNVLQFSVVLFLWCTLYFSIKQWLSIENRAYIVRLSDGSEHRFGRTCAERLENWLASGKS
jgi:hypothetical protein